jgi:hypothetical protein
MILGKNICGNSRFLLVIAHISKFFVMASDGTVIGKEMMRDQPSE